MLTLQKKRAATDIMYGMGVLIVILYGKIKIKESHCSGMHCGAPGVDGGMWRRCS